MWPQPSASSVMETTVPLWVDRCGPSDAADSLCFPSVVRRGPTNSAFREWRPGPPEGATGGPDRDGGPGRAAQGDAAAEHSAPISPQLGDGTSRSGHHDDVVIGPCIPVLLDHRLVLQHGVPSSPTTRRSHPWKVWKVQ
jgi:hypothetical protein